MITATKRCTLAMGQAGDKEFSAGSSAKPKEAHFTVEETGTVG